MSLLGLVRHLAEVERATFRVLLAGEDAPRLFCSDDDRDGDFDGAVADPSGGGRGVGGLAGGGGLRRPVVASATSLDITSDDPRNQHGSGGGAISLREALVGMIWEYARHWATPTCLRERIDGRIGQ